MESFNAAEELQALEGRLKMPLVPKSETLSLQVNDILILLLFYQHVYVKSRNMFEVGSLWPHR